jgi:hypothetical protein
MEKEYRIPTHFSDDRVTEAPDMVPARSWMMSDETEKWVVCGHTPGDQASLHSNRRSGAAEGELHNLGARLQDHPGG